MLWLEVFLRHGMEMPSAKLNTQVQNTNKARPKLKSCVWKSHTNRWCVGLLLPHSHSQHSMAYDDMNLCVPVSDTDVLAGWTFSVSACRSVGQASTSLSL